MAKTMKAGDQVGEICQELRSAVESYWVFRGMSEFVESPENVKIRDRFWLVYAVLVNNSFDCMVVAIFNLLDRSTANLSLLKVAEVLEREEGVDAAVVGNIRQVYFRHESLWKAICRVRNNGVAHLNDKKTSSSHLLDANIKKEAIGSFLQDAISILKSLERYSSWYVGAPHHLVESQAAQLFELSARSD